MRALAITWKAKKVWCVNRKQQVRLTCLCSTPVGNFIVWPACKLLSVLFVGKRKNKWIIKILWVCWNICCHKFGNRFPNFPHSHVLFVRGPTVKMALRIITIILCAESLKIWTRRRENFLVRFHRGFYFIYICFRCICLLFASKEIRQKCFFASWDAWRSENIKESLVWAGTHLEAHCHITMSAPGSMKKANVFFFSTFKCHSHWRSFYPFLS